MSSDEKHLMQHFDEGSSTQLIRAKKWEIKLFGFTLLSRYENPWEFLLPSVLKYLLYLIGPRHVCRPGVPCTDDLNRNLPVSRPHFDDIRQSVGQTADRSVSLTWLGHAGCLFTFRSGVTVLCDPVFSPRASPVSWMGPLRKRPSPCTPEELPEITAVCISHNHFDHMDRATLSRLVELQPNVEFYVPKGDGWWIVKYCGAKQSLVHELEWWDSGYKEVSDSSPLEVVFTPSSHWSGRTMLDKNRSLWGSFVLRCNEDTVYFAGDSGYQAEIFKRIGQCYGPMKLAAIPIGAYAPRDIFQAQHVSPVEAVQIHKDVRSQKSVGIHWGTFCLSTIEGLLQPPDDLRQAMSEAGLQLESFVAVNPGSSVYA